MDDHDKRLLNAIQADFPLSARPFHTLGTALGLAEAEVIARLGEHKRQRLIRQIGGIFDTRSLGYQSSLVAMRVRPDRLEAAAQRGEPASRREPQLRAEPRVQPVVHGRRPLRKRSALDG